MLQHSIASIVEVTWERFYNIASNVLEEDVSKQQAKGLGSHLRKMLRPSMKGITEVTS